jgi:hypothetical protein
MNARARAARRTIRQRRRDNQATHKAHKNVATGRPQPASTHLVAAGLTPADAKRFAGAFSRGVIADSTRQATVKLKGRTRKTVSLKLYARTTFALRLATYRPRDKAAAARFERIALAA